MRLTHAITHKPATPSHCLYYAIALFDGHYDGWMLVLVAILFCAEFREFMLDLE